MNILFISHDSSHTGAPLALLSLLKSIKTSVPDMKFSVFCKKNGPLVEDFKQVCPVILPTGKPWYLKTLFTPTNFRDRLSIRLFLQHIKHQRFDMIYANSASSLSCAVILKTHLHIPILLHFHESNINQCYIHTRRNWIRECDHFIAVSQLSFNSLVELGGNPSRIHIIYPTSIFIPILLSERQSLIQFHNQKQKTIIGFVGPLIDRKGADLLAIVMKRLSDKYPNCEFEIWSIGNYLDQERRRVEYDANRLGVRDKITFIDSLNNPIPTYRETDILLVLSREESFSLVVVEFGLLGKPVILFDGSCGVQHFLRNDQNAIIVPYLDINGIAEAIYMLSQDREKCHLLGENLRNVMRNHYLQTDTNEEIIKILSSMDSSD